MKLGIVLEGGGMRGLYSAGILDVLMEEGIVADGLVGVSAGAVFGSNYMSKQIGRAIRYNKKVCKDPRYGTIRSLIKSGDMFEVEFCYHEIPEQIDPVDVETYRNNPMEFYVTCADVSDASAVYHRSVSMEESLKWLQASASMPMVSRPVQIGGKEYLDGGIADSIPISFMRQKGFDRNIVVLTRPRGYRKTKNKFMLPAKIILRKMPAVIAAMKTRHINYNHTLEKLEELEKNGEVFAFYPKKEDIVSRTESDPNRLQKIYDAGRRDALENLEELKKFVEKVRVEKPF